MTYTQQLKFLNDWLLSEMPQYQEQARQFPKDDAQQRRLLRSLMNVRPPMPLDPEFLAVQDELLSAEREMKGVVAVSSLPATKYPGVRLWRGDITRLAADAIVNAGNSALLGCFVPCHGCIDNAIHSAAGLQLREECRRLMDAQGHEEADGGAKLTPAFNLPSKYVLHTVGPIVRGSVTERDRQSLASCYESCLKSAAEHGLKSSAFSILRAIMA